MEGLARRVAEGHEQAAPVLRRALARLRGAAELKENGIPLAVLVSLATDELWDIESRRELADRLAAADRGQGALYALGMTLLVAGQAEIVAGRFAEADACYAQADDFFAATGFAGGRGSQPGLPARLERPRRRAAGSAGTASRTLLTRSATGIMLEMGRCTRWPCSTWAWAATSPPWTTRWRSSATTRQRSATSCSR